jgi:hypothetical protein
MKPQIKISIAPAPLEQVLTAEFEAEQRKLLALHHAAPELLDALKELAPLLDGKKFDGYRQHVSCIIAKAEGK